MKDIYDSQIDGEKYVKRNPHPDFKKVEESRPIWNETLNWNYTKTRKPDWKPGEGGNDGGESLQKKHIEIDPYEEGRKLFKEEVEWKY